MRFRLAAAVALAISTLGSTSHARFRLPWSKSADKRPAQPLDTRVKELTSYFTGIERRLGMAAGGVRGYEANVCFFNTATVASVPICNAPYPLAGLDLGLGAGLYLRGEPGGMQKPSLRVIGYAGAGANATGATLSRVTYQVKKPAPAPKKGIRRLLMRAGKFVKLETRTLAGAALLIGGEKALAGRGSEITPGTYRASSVTFGLGPELAQQVRVGLEIPLPGRFRGKTRRVLDEALTLLNMEGLDAHARAERIPRLEALQNKMQRLERDLPPVPSQGQ